MKFLITGFGDEIADSLDVQLDTLEECGLKVIDVRKVDGIPVANLTIEQAKAAMEKIRARGFTVTCFGSPCGKVSITSDFDEHLKVFKHCLELCKIFETKRFRMFSFLIPAGENAYDYQDEVLRRLHVMVDLAKAEGIKLYHENEKVIFGDIADRCKILGEEFGDDLPQIFDPSNFIQCGEKIDEAYEKIGKYVRYLHVKDALYEKEPEDGKGQVRPAGQGAANFMELLKKLQKDGQTECISIEHHLRLPCWGETGVERFKTAFAAIDALNNQLD